MQRRERATWGDLEDSALADGPARKACPVEVAVGPLDQRPSEFATLVQSEPP